MGSEMCIRDRVIVAALILLPRTRLLGALGGLGLLAGAIGFHISPWLGIEVEGMGHGLFITALALTALTVTLLLCFAKKDIHSFLDLNNGRNEEKETRR